MYKRYTCESRTCPAAMVVYQRSGQAVKMVLSRSPRCPLGQFGQSQVTTVHRPVVLTDQSAGVHSVKRKGPGKTANRPTNVSSTATALQGPASQVICPRRIRLHFERTETTLSSLERCGRKFTETASRLLVPALQDCHGMGHCENCAVSQSQGSQIQDLWKAVAMSRFRRHS